MNSSLSDEQQTGKKSSSGRGRARGRGRPPGRPKGSRGKKKAVVGRAVKHETDADIDNENDFLAHISPKLAEVNEASDSDITSHAISFVSQSSKALNWKYKVNLIGEKVVNPRIHCCEKCKLPILVYGRMIPCKHIFCLSCAKQNEITCPRCNDKVLRVEKSGLGTVFMCQTESCKRTYLSQRDLQAHIQHRHVKRLLPTHSPGLASNPSNNVNLTTNPTNTSLQSQSHASNSSSSSRNMSYNSNTYQSPIPVVSSRSNLITVPIQDEVNVLNQMQSSVNSQSSMIVSNQQQIPNYVSPQQYANQHHNQHMQWQQSMANANAFNYRPPHWPPITHPYNPYNRPPYFQ